MGWNPFKRKRRDAAAATSATSATAAAQQAATATAPPATPPAATAATESPAHPAPPTAPAAGSPGAFAAPFAPTPAGVPQPVRSAEDIERHVIDVLRTVYDPEIPIDIYELGLIYEVKVGDGGTVDIVMTLTSPACPVAGTLPPEVEEKVAAVAGVNDVNVELTWDPPWGPDKMSEAARLQLGM
jgi:FeS assembly SUF system protein